MLCVERRDVDRLPAAASIRLHSRRANRRSRRRPLAPGAGAEGLRRRREVGNEVDAIRRAVVSPIGASPFDGLTVTRGMRPAAIGPPPRQSRTVSAGPPATMTPRLPEPRWPRLRTVPRPCEPHPRREPIEAIGAGDRQQQRPRRADERQRPRAPPASLANSVVQGAIRTDARKPTETAYTRRPRALAGIVLGSVIMKNRKTRISGRGDEQPPEVRPPIGPRCQRAVIAWPDAARTPTPAAKVSQNAAGDPQQLQPRQDDQPADDDQRQREHEPRTDIGPHQKSSGSARSGRAARSTATRPKFDGLKTWPSARADHVLGQERHGRGRGEDPPAVHAPPVAVLGARHAEDERHAVAGEQRARRPHQHPLAPERDRRPRARRR